MATSQQHPIIEQLRRTALVRDGAGLTDGQLLECFIARQEEAAFEAIVRRHGAMVLSVCRRVLGNAHDAEDAFQATFLVLARKAATIRSRELVSNWLYGVAYQTALKATALAAKRQSRERLMNEMPEPEAAPQDPSPDWLPLLDQELHCLPDKYRVPMVLCDLEGKSRRDAAQQLGLPEGTLSSRLARARTMLAKRLVRHGIALSGGAVATILTQNAASACVPPALLGTTVKAAITPGGIVSAQVAALAECVLRTMLWAKLKLKMAVATLLLLGIGVLAGGLDSNPMPVAAQGTNFEANPAGKKAAETDQEKMQGAWLLASSAGKANPPCFAGLGDDVSRLLIVDGERLSMNSQEKGLTFTLDAARRPKTIDLKSEDGKIVLGIYHLDGDDLRFGVCIAEKQQRPASFAAANVMVLEFKRQRPEPVSVPQPQTPAADIRTHNKTSCFVCHVFNTWTAGQKATWNDGLRIQGSWQLIEVLQDGVASRDDLGTVDFGPRLMRAGNVSDGWIFALNAGEPNKLITLKAADGKIILGIYHLEGDDLKLCFCDLNKKQRRPTNFAAIDPDMVYWHLRRR